MRTIVKTEAKKLSDRLLVLVIEFEQVDQGHYPTTAFMISESILELHYERALQPLIQALKDKNRDIGLAASEASCQNRRACHSATDKGFER